MSYRRDSIINILFISPNSPYESVGGVERHIINLIEYSKKQKDFNSVVLLPTSKESSVWKDGAVTVYVDSSINLTRNSSTKSIGEQAKQFSKLVEKIIIDQNIDIICAENFPIGLPPAYSILLNIVAVQHNIPLILRLHSFATSEIQTELTNQLMWNKISCVSKSVTGDCFQKGADIDILSTDYLGVDTDTFKPNHLSDMKMRNQLGLAPNHKVILTASRIIQGKTNILQAKGFINLIQAFSKISSRHSNARLVIAVGKAPSRLKEEFEESYSMLEGYIKLHGIEDVTIVKTFALEEMPAVYNLAEVFVLASENETFGQVFVEAMGSGLPVIGTKVGGIPEIISDSRNGYLIPPNDVSALIQRIDKLLIDQATADDFRQAGIKTVIERFTLDKQLGDFIAKLRETI